MNINKPNRKKHSYTQHLDASPEKVFPLLCPVLEANWVPGWMPKLVLSHSGVCEQDCVFVTTPNGEEPQNAIWVVTRYDPDNWSLKMHKVIPEYTVTKLEISLYSGNNNPTDAHITYEITAIGPSGDEFVQDFTEEWYKTFMLDWEKAMNHYLNAGEIIAERI